MLALCRSLICITCLSSPLAALGQERSSFDELFGSNQESETDNQKGTPPSLPSLDGLPFTEHDLGFRKWSDATGKFSVVGRFEGFGNGTVLLARQDNRKQVEVKIELLAAPEIELLTHLKKNMNVVEQIRIEQDAGAIYANTEQIIKRLSGLRVALEQMVHDDKLTDSSKAEKRESLLRGFTTACLRAGTLEFPTSLLKWSTLEDRVAREGIEYDDESADFGMSEETTMEKTILTDFLEKAPPVVGYPTQRQPSKNYDEVISYYKKLLGSEVCFEVASATKGSPPLLSMGKASFKLYDNSKESLADHLRKLEIDARKPRIISLSFSKERLNFSRLSNRTLHVYSLFGMSVDRFNPDDIQVKADAFKTIPANIHDAVNIRAKQYCAELMEFVNYDWEGDFGNTPTQRRGSIQRNAGFAMAEALAKRLTTIMGKPIRFDRARNSLDLSDTEFKPAFVANMTDEEYEATRKSVGRVEEVMTNKVNGEISATVSIQTNSVNEFGVPELATYIFTYMPTPLDQRVTLNGQVIRSGKSGKIISEKRADEKAATAK